MTPCSTITTTTPTRPTGHPPAPPRNHSTPSTGTIPNRIWPPRGPRRGACSVKQPSIPSVRTTTISSTTIPPRPTCRPPPPAIYPAETVTANRAEDWAGRHPACQATAAIKSGATENPAPGIPRPTCRKKTKKKKKTSSPGKRRKSGSKRKLRGDGNKCRKEAHPPRGIIPLHPAT